VLLSVQVNESVGFLAPLLEGRIGAWQFPAP